jgi:hypothetical protein
MLVKVNNIDASKNKVKLTKLDIDDPMLLGEFYDINLHNKNRLLQEIYISHFWRIFKEFSISI